MSSPTSAAKGARRYRGRFAPSPSGPLHMGSLLSALASYLDARSHNGEWLLRIEDLDPPREVAGADDLIKRTLKAHGLVWDETVVYQSTRLAAYIAVLDRLNTSGDLFACSCTRTMLGPNGACDARCTPNPSEATSTRIQLKTTAKFVDHFWGERCLPAGPVDQILRRKDGLYAYALAVVVDDADQQITHVVRGEDLEAQTPAQEFLHRKLGKEPPSYGHVPLIYNEFGKKLSKQTGAPPVDDSRALENLRALLELLNQPPPESELASVEAVLAAAVSRWEPSKMPSASTHLRLRNC
ncbi:MAG: tRNA glutamyl-Q(34) synthetase GluQRS [Pseudomonadota bacterium]